MGHAAFKEGGDVTLSVFVLYMYVALYNIFISACTLLAHTHALYYTP